MIRGAILAAGLAVGATAASAETVFSGMIRITATTVQCQGTHIGDISPSRFHPFFAGQATHAEGLTFIYPLGGSGYTLASHVFDPTFREVQSGYLGSSGVVVQPQPHRSQIAVAARPVINNTTPTLVLKGQIKRPDDDGGGLACVASFTGVYVKEQ